MSWKLLIVFLSTDAATTAAAICRLEVHSLFSQQELACDLAVLRDHIMASYGCISV
jgi:hypothetical protein